jgi:hypothetical protein
MTTAVTIKNVDEALINRYSGITIDTGDPPSSTGVTAFIEEPASEVYTERTYPAVAIKLMSMLPAYDRAHTDDEDQEEVDYDPIPSPPIRTMRQRGLPYDIIYSLDTWHKIRVGESRDLITEAIVQRTPPRGYMTVEDVDGGDQDVWVIWYGGLGQLDEILPDGVMYHKSLSIRVMVDLLSIPTTEDKKVVTTIDWKLYNRTVTYDIDGNVVLVPGGDIYDHTLRITESGEEHIP